MSLQFLQPYFGLGNGLQTKNVAGGGGVGGWVELGRTTLGSAGDDITVSSLANKRYYMFLQSHISSGTTASPVRLNSDTGSNYAARENADGGADTTITSTDRIFTGSVDSVNGFLMGYVANKSDKEKLLNLHLIRNTATGAGTAPNRQDTAGKWANTSNAISSITTFNSEAGSYDTNSELVVLGWDPADTHTNNFWTELSSTTLASANANLSSGTITAKKYLWLQAALIPTAAHDVSMTFNNDTAGNYATRDSRNGASDSLNTSVSSFNITPATSPSVIWFVNAFGINVSSKEKLWIGHIAYAETAGAGNAPRRNEFVGKWINTSSQITEIDLNSTTSTFASGSTIKVYGSD